MIEIYKHLLLILTMLLFVENLWAWKIWNNEIWTENKLKINQNSYRKSKKFML